MIQRTRSLCVHWIQIVDRGIQRNSDFADPESVLLSMNHEVKHVRKLGRRYSWNRRIWISNRETVPTTYAELSGLEVPQHDWQGNLWAASASADENSVTIGHPELNLIRICNWLHPKHTLPHSSDWTAHKPGNRGFNCRSEAREWFIKANLEYRKMPRMETKTDIRV